MGFEPTTSAVTGRRSNQLSHQAKSKARDGIRTRDPRLGKAILHH